ncbi:uncharacterized protein BDR25DRAFT_317979 [Lindgomyces ingoldianus]|uniref:Uncharacterized protein n=1 Tax=Lindgomyces ingoldianus TaxID=673940 RepID=A0ACB6QJ75_9PLEO|nr:uncharacterized protein BDR25DRAFT_317979 [Lindgomyces ingoldianus]KAF2466190.1 hypothetical protein BDR25DRAFT_317979 [Lindgomyces ingoldianus]
MASRKSSPPDSLIPLAHALGYSDYPHSNTASPYLNYILNQHIARTTLEEYLSLFQRIIAHFSIPDVLEDGRPQRDSIQVLLDELVASNGQGLFIDTPAGSVIRKEDVEDTVLYILGVWTMMLSSFVRLPNGFRKVIVAYNHRAQRKVTGDHVYEDSLAGLIRGSGLLPSPGNWSHVERPENDVVRAAMSLVALISSKTPPGRSSPDTSRSPSTSSLFEEYESTLWQGQITSQSLDDMDSLESLEIKATRLNAFTLNVLGAVEISWTFNLSRHLVLSKHRGRYGLEIFALPCVFAATTLTSATVGIAPELAQEIQESYRILFNAWPNPPLHAKLGTLLGVRKICWCWSCSAYRYRNRTLSTLKKKFSFNSRRTTQNRDVMAKSEFDPLLIELMSGNSTSNWTYDLFPCLWPRITMLEDHLQRAKPWNIWILFRDRRDTLQFWTFFFATVVVMLTFFQVALGIAQVVGSFL